MQKILLTNFSIKNYTGSEIDTVTIANYFKNKNYQVDIFTLDKGLPLLDKLHKGINVINFNEIEKLSKKYDIVWAHHSPLLDYILFNLKIKAKYVYYISLSSFEPYEAAPIYANKLSKIGVMSKDVKNQLLKEGVKSQNITIFPNYATNDFFKSKTKRINRINKICIVSNHVPKELYDFKKICEQNSIIIDIYGKNNIEKLIDRKVLEKYDLIISIGKTLFYSTAMGKLSYCYDYFGGYGFITKNNINYTFNHNFSGRIGGIKKTGEEIYNDIIDNYNETQNDLQAVKEFAHKNYNFENNINKFLSDTKNNLVDYSFIKNNIDYSRISKLFVEKTYVSNNTINFLKIENNILNEKLQGIYNSRLWKYTKTIRFLRRKLIKAISIIKKNSLIKK